MTQSTSAAFHIQGTALRYAEVGHGPEGMDLQRLGRRTFEFDVARALWEGETGALDRLGTVVQEVSSTLKASTVQVVVHPLDVYSFAAPLPAGLSDPARRRHATHQTALATGARSPDTLHISLRSTRTVETEGETIEWVHVLAVPEAVDERLQALVEALPAEVHGRMVTSEAAARLMGRVEQGEEVSAPDADGYSLAIGQYPTHTEYALTHNRAWWHAHAAQEARSPENRAYYAVGMLNRIGVPTGAVDRVFAYGAAPATDLADVSEAVFGVRPTSLDPFSVFRRTSGPPQEEAPGLYAPCIGGALEPLA